MTRPHVAILAAAWLVAALLTVPAAGQSPTQNPDTGSFDARYARGQQVNASIRTLTASFIETTQSSLLTQPLVARGTLAVERPSRVVLHYTQPNVRTVLIDRNKMTVTWPSTQTLDVGAAMGRIEKMFVNGSAKDLRQQFDIDDRQTGERAGIYHVVMTPKQRRIREGLTRLELWVDEQTSLLSAIRMTFPNGDSKHMAFEQVTPNATLPAGVFTLDR